MSKSLSNQHECKPVSWPQSSAKRMLVAILLSAVAATGYAQSCTAPLSDQIYWISGDDEYDDRAGFHNASTGGSVEFVTGKIGRGLNFNEDADQVTPDVAVSEMRAVRDNFTYEFWARPTAATPACPESQNGNCSGSEQRVALFPQHGDTGADAGELGLAAGIGVIVATNAVCVTEHAAFHLPCLLRHDATISSTQFTHVAVVVENRQPRLYLNGVLVRTGLTSPKDFVFASWNLIGSGLGLGKYRGDLDELSVYARVLSDAEILAIFNAGASGKCKRACLIEARNDAWQAAAVTMHTGLRSTNADGMFGADNASPEPTTTIFADGQADGSVHAIEWETAASIRLAGFSVAAFHDAPGNFQRGFRHLRLQGRPAGGSFVTLYDSSVALPYAPGDRELRRCVNLRPMQAQQFRAEFTQQGPPGFSGPRVAELDEFDSGRVFRDGFE